MLTALSIANIVLIERLDLDFEAGLGVLRANQGALARLLAGLQELLKRA